MPRIEWYSIDSAEEEPDDGRQGVTLFRFGEFELDSERYELRRGLAEVPAEAKVLDFLIFLIENRNRIVPKHELLARVWVGLRVTEQSIAQALFTARRILSDDSRAPRFIQTIRGRGLRFIAAVTERERATASPGFVGREDVLTQLAAELDTIGSEGRLVLVSGEAGIGKSHLAAEFSSRARESGATVHLGRCIETKGTPPYWPWIALLRSHAGRGETHHLRSLMADAPALAEVAPDLAHATTSHRRSDSSERFRLFDSVTRFWTGVSRGERTVLIIDDIHRSDGPSRELLVHVVRQLHAIPLLIVATHREPAIGAEQAWPETATSLKREDRCVTVRLGGLGEADVASFVRSIRGEDPDSAEVAHLHARSAGNPFFLAQLLRHSRDTSPVSVLPRSLSEAITSHLSGLSRNCDSTLSIASILGRDFSSIVLAQLARVLSPDLEVRDAVAEALVAGVLVEESEHPGHVRFSHVLVRDALYSKLSLDLRSKGHSVVVDILERENGVRSPAELSSLAHHAVEAIPFSGVDRAVNFSGRAGVAALAALAFEESALHLERAIALEAQSGALDHRRRFDLLLALGEAQARAYSREEARVTLRAAASLAKALDSPDDLARVALGISPGFFAIEVGVVDPFIVSLLEESLALLPNTDSAIRARVQGRLAMALYWSDYGPRRVALIREAQETAERLSDPRTKAFVLSSRIFSLWRADNLESRMSGANELIRLSTREREWELLLIGQVYRITCLIELGDIGEMERELHRFERNVADHAIPQARWYVDLYRANLCLDRGDLDQAEAHLGRISDFRSRFLDVNIDHSLGALLGILHWRRGDSSAFVPATKALAGRYPSVVAWKLGVALFLLDDDRVTEAREIVTSLFRTEADALPDDAFRIIGLCLAAQICSALNLADIALSIRSLLVPYQDRFAAVGFGTLSWGSIARALGLLSTVLEDWESAQYDFERAAEMEARAGSFAWVADTYREHARMLLLRGDSSGFETARKLLTKSLRLGRDCGLVRTVNQAECVYRDFAAELKL